MHLAEAIPTDVALGYHLLSYAYVEIPRNIGGATDRNVPALRGDLRAL